MFEAVIAPIAFALIMLGILGAAVVAYIRRRAKGTDETPAARDRARDDQRRAS